MTYNVFGGTLNLALSLCQFILQLGLVLLDRYLQMILDVCQWLVDPVEKVCHRPGFLSE